MIKIANINFYTVNEVANMLQISHVTLRKYIKAGKLKAQKIGRPILIQEQAVKEFLGESIAQPENTVKETEAK